MLIELTYDKILTRVEFPVYALTGELTYRDGLLKCNDKVIDDRNQKQSTLGRRRLHTPHRKYLLNIMYEDFTALVKSKYKNFIDTKGNCFRYLKTKYVSIKSIKIKNKEFLDYYCRLWLYGYNSPFVLKSAPLGKEWAHVIIVNNEPWLIYDFSENKCKSYRRMI